MYQIVRGQYDNMLFSQCRLLSNCSEFFVPGVGLLLWRLVLDSKNPSEHRRRLFGNLLGLLLVFPFGRLCLLLSLLFLLPHPIPGAVVNFLINQRTFFCAFPVSLGCWFVGSVQKKEAELMQKWWVEICQAYLLPSFNVPAANRGWDGVGRVTTGVSGSGAGTQGEPKPTDGGTYLCLLQFFCCYFSRCPRQICIIFGQCLPDSFCSCYFCYRFFYADIFTCGGHWPLHILGRI